MDSDTLFWNLHNMFLYAVYPGILITSYFLKKPHTLIPFYDLSLQLLYKK